MKQTLPVLLLALAVSATTGFAQTADGGPDPAQVRVRIGPLWMNPTLALSNAGIDTNVFNQSDPDHPQRDFTLTVSPTTDLWLRMGRTWLSATIKEDIIWFQKFASERSANNSYRLGWSVPLSRLALKTNASYVSTRERPGFEIDARSQRYGMTYDGSIEYRALSKTFFGVQASRQRLQFDKDAVFLGTNLHDALNRHTTDVSITARHQLTPLTNVVISASRKSEHFDVSSLRDSDATSLNLGLKFDPFAILKGSASFGFTDFMPRDSSLPGYKGSTAAVDLTYTLLGMTRLAVQIQREIQFSFDAAQPYYVLTGINVSIAQQIFGPLDVIGRIGAERLDYRDAVGASQIVGPTRTDHVRLYGGGVGYHFGKNLRLGLNIDQQHRASPFPSRQFNGLKIGTAVTYEI